MNDVQEHLAKMLRKEGKIFIQGDGCACFFKRSP